MFTEGVKEEGQDPTSPAVKKEEGDGGVKKEEGEDEEGGEKKPVQASSGDSEQVKELRAQLK